jgi:hypothetical protein
MAESRARAFAKLAKDVNTSGNIVAEGISSDVTLGGATIYASRASLPTSGNTAGDQAYVTGNNRLYIWNGSGWYNVALLNVAPSIQSVLDSDGNSTPFNLAIDGTPTTITITALDSDGDPVTYAASADSDFSGLATLSQADNVFTITPFSQDSATTESGTITFTATDGVNVASSGIQTFTLSFLSEYWDETVLSIGTSSANGLANGTFIDRSTNSFTFTKAGTPTQTAFHPYLDNWSVEFNGTSDYVRADNALSTLTSASDPWTIEMWFWSDGNDFTGPAIPIGINASNNGDNVLLYRGGSVILAATTYDFSSTMPQYQWVHIAMTYDGTTLKVYHDGTEVSSDSVTFLTAFSNCVLGIATEFDGANGGNAGNFTKGWMSNFRVSNNVRYTSSFTPSTSKLSSDANTLFLGLQSNRFIDESSANVTVTPYSSPEISAFNPFGQGSEYTPGENKGSAEFGSGDKLTRATTGFYTVTSFCMEFWIYPLSDQSHYICEGTQQGSGTWRITIDSSGGGIGFSYAAGSWAGVNFGTGAGHFNSREWTHIAITKTSAGVYRIFINGVQQGTQTNTSSLINTARNFQFGYYVDGSGTSYSNALYSDFKITRQDPVYTSGFTVPTAPVGGTNVSTNDPYMYLPFDNAGVFDKTGNNTLTLTGSTATSTTQTKFATTSMYAGGTMTTDNSVAHFGTNDFTIEGWFYLNSVSVGYQPLWANYGTADQQGLILITETTNRFAFYFSNGSSWSYNNHTATTPTANQWMHLSVVRSGSTITGYYNGNSIGTANIGTNSTHDLTTGKFSLGYYPYFPGGARSLDGYIENFQILKGVAKYTTNFTPPDRTQGRIYQAES